MLLEKLRTEDDRRWYVAKAHGKQLVAQCEITGIGRVAGTVVEVAAPRASALGVGHQPTATPEVRRVALGFDERVPKRFKDNLRKSKEAS